jgi:membrane protein
METAGDWMEDNALRLSAALAYYSVFSIAPLLVICVGLAGWFFGADAVRGQLDNQLRGLVGGQAAQAIQSMVQSTSQPSKSLLATVIGVVTLLIGASGVFGQLKDALNTIWGVKAKPGVGWRRFVRERLLSFSMVLVIGFLLLVSFLLTALLSAFNEWIAALVSLPGWMLAGAAMLVSFAIITLLFASIFKVLPDVQIDWRHVWVGAAATAFLFELGKFGLAFYLGRESTASSFGAAGSVVLLLLWVYYASCLLLFGAEFTKVYAATNGAKLQPTALAELIRAEPDAAQATTPHAAVEPSRESLPVIFAGTAVVESISPRQWRALSSYIREHMMVGILGAAGFGAALGLVSRAAPHERNTDPSEQIRASTRVLGFATLLLLTRFGRELRRRIHTTFSHRSQPWLRRLLPRT